MWCNLTFFAVFLTDVNLNGGKHNTRCLSKSSGRSSCVRNHEEAHECAAPLPAPTEILHVPMLLNELIIWLQRKILLRNNPERARLSSCIK